MKVRHKKLGVELDIVGGDVNGPYFQTRGGSLIHVNDPDWQVVPTETWRDVTGECETNNCDLYHEEVVVGGLGMNGVMGAYRLRKVHLFDHGQGQDGTGFMPREQWAFIIERKEPV